MAHLSRGVSLVPVGYLFGRGIGWGLVSRLVPTTLTFSGSLGSGGGGSSSPIDSFQVSRFSLFCQLLTNLSLNTE